MPADYPSNREWPYATVRIELQSGMFTVVEMCRRCGALLPAVDPEPDRWSTPVELHDQMHDTLDSIAAILEQHREVNERG